MALLGDTKTATYRVDAFRSPDTGPLGYADADGQVVLYQRPVPPHRLLGFAPEALAAVPRVDIVVSFLGADGALIDVAVAAGARGIVAAGTGAGKNSPTEDDALDRAVKAGVVVCQATRVGAGRVPRSGELAARRLVAAEGLLPWKARFLLGLGLTRTQDPDALQDLFDRARPTAVSAARPRAPVGHTPLEGAPRVSPRGRRSG